MGLVIQLIAVSYLLSLLISLDLNPNCALRADFLVFGKRELWSRLGELA